MKSIEIIRVMKCYEFRLNPTKKKLHLKGGTAEMMEHSIEDHRRVYVGPELLL